MMDPQLQEESKAIFAEKMSMHKDIQISRKKLEEINEMVGHMENKVLEQELLTSSFKEIGEVGLIHIDKGNKNLV